MSKENSSEGIGMFFKVGTEPSGKAIYQRCPRGRSYGRTSPLVTGASLVVTDKEGKTQCRYIPEDQEQKEDSRYREHQTFNPGMNGHGNTNIHELQTRQRMRPWLESRINSGEIQGLEWLDRDSKTFKVPWKHVGNRDWCESDGKIFKEWAIHTGKYRENVDQQDYPTWKTRFRCALTKLPDIKELKELNRLDQQMVEPFRVYRFLPRSTNHADEVPLTPITPYETQTTNPGYEDYDMGIGQACPDTEPSIPTTVHSGTVSLDDIPSGDIFHPSNDIDIPDRIESVDKKDLNIAPCVIKQECEEDMETTEAFPNDNMAVSDDKQISTIANKPFPGQNVVTQKDIKSITFDQHDNTIHVTVKYTQDTVIEKAVSNPAGCHIYYELNVKLSRRDEHLQQMMFGPSEAIQISLPECQAMNTHQVHLTSELLRALDRGLLLRMENGNIIATRKCRCSIFVSSPSLNNGVLTKLVREHPTVVFDLHNYFMPNLNKYLYRLGPKPEAGFVLSFGQRFTDTKESLHNLLISATVDHSAARNVLTKIACSSPLSPPIEISNSDNYDRILDVIHFSTQNTGFEIQPQTAFG